MRAKEAVRELEEIASSALVDLKIDGVLKPSSNIYVARIENNGYIQSYYESADTSVSTNDEEFTRPRRATSPTRQLEEQIEVRKRSSSTNTKLPKVNTPTSLNVKESPKYKAAETPSCLLEKNAESCSTFSAVAESVSLETLKRSKTPAINRFMEIHRRSPMPQNDSSPKRALENSIKNRFPLKESVLFKKNSWFNANSSRCCSIKEKLKLIRESYNNARCKVASYR
mmetsp:Transcript_29343/g.29076  ORF Transcript_29343/g.29076 Transcript_29343/m.29076 type:complete len:227 (-) Transcript_29343:21-701(-)